MKKYIHYIINASAGGRRPERMLRKLRRLAPASVFTVTRDEQELETLFVKREATAKVYVAVGGDGTVRGLAEQVYRTGNQLGIIRMGSGNGLARELGIPEKLKEQIQVVEQGFTRNIDLLSINGDTGVNVAGLGFDAEVAYRFARIGIRGLVGYILSSLQALWCFNLFYAQITGQFIKEEGVYWMITFANTGQFGNNAKIAPQARCDDGVMDIVLVKPFPLVMLPIFLFQLFTGSLKPSKYIKYIRSGTPVSVTCSETRFHIDGDQRGKTDEKITVSLISKAIQVIVPENPRNNFEKSIMLSIEAVSRAPPKSKGLTHRLIKRF